MVERPSNRIRFLGKEYQMSTAHKPLVSLHASDLMCSAVVVIPRDASLREAAKLLAREQISGAPVIDAAGRCVGVLSATDFFRPRLGTFDVPLDDAVAAHMTADPVTVAPTTPLRQLARMMLDAHIHRVIVVDVNRRPVGVVSSTDILAATAYADEPS
jgi:CBS domain-containing protein